MDIIQGNTIDVDLTLDTPLGDMVLKAGLYSANGTAIYEAYTNNGSIVFVDNTHYSFSISHEITRMMSGQYTLQLTSYTDDRMLVAAGNQIIEINVIPMAVNINLK